MDTTGITPVMPIGSGTDGFGGFGGIFMIFAIVALLMFGGGGFGLGGNNGNSNAIQNDINRGFDSQNLQAQTRDILSAVNAGTAQTVAATNQSFHDNLMAMQGLYNETARDIAALAVGQANQLAAQNACCCETKMLIQSTAADTNARFTAEIQGIKDMIAQNKIEALQAQVSQLQLQAATANVLRFPNAWTYAGGYFPPIQPTTGGAAA